MNQSSAQYLQKARKLAASGKLREALDLCLKAAGMEPESDEPLRGALPVYITLRRTDEALDWLKTIIARHPTPYRAAALLDLMRMERAKKDDLAEAARKYLGQWPDDANVLLSGGAALQAANEPEEAIAAYEKRLELVPNDAGVLNNLGHCRLDRGDMEGALAEWRKILGMEVPAHVRDTARYNLARALLLRGDMMSAEAECAILCKDAPDNGAYLGLLAKIRAERGQKRDALREAKEALEKDRGDVNAWLRLVRLTGESGDLEGAFGLLEQAAHKARKPLEARKALAQARLGRGDEAGALRDLKAWATGDAREAEYPLMLARLHESRGRFEEALEWCKKAEKVDWKAGGLALVRFYEAREEAEKAREKAGKMLARDERNVFHHGLYAETCHSLGLYAEALEAVEKGLALEPTNLALSGQKINMLLLAERYEDAEAFARKQTELDPQAKNWLRLVAILRQRGKVDEAIEVTGRMYAENPNDILWLDEHAAALALGRKLREAAELLEKARIGEPKNLKIARRLLAIYRELDEHEKARALAIDMRGGALASPAEITALAGTLRDMGNLEEGLALAKDGVSRFADNIGLWGLACDFLRRLDRPQAERAMTLEILRRFPPEKSVKSCGLNLVRIHERIHGQLPAIESPDIQAIIARIRQWAKNTPNHPDIWWFQAAIAEKLNRSGDALAAMDAIERRFPDNPAVYERRANILSKMNRATAALEYRRKALALRPNSVGYTQALLDELVKNGDFSEFDQLMARIKHLLGHKRYGYYRNLFFNLNCHPTYSGGQIWEYFRDWYENAVKPGLPAQRPLNVGPGPRKIRLGYVSPDFRRHSMAYFMEPIFRGQRIAEFRDNFEVFAYAHFDPGQKDKYSEMFKNHVDHWVEISSMGDDELERKIRADGIDILIDMAGQTANNRLTMFLRRPAPVLCEWIYGYVQTSGLPEFDWMVCDAQEVPPEHESFMAEKNMARFSFGGHPYAPPPDAHEPKPLPCAANGYVTFGVTTQPRRVNGECIAAWAEILKQAPTAKIRFQREVYLEPEIQRLISGRFARYGIGPERLEFVCVKPLWEAYSAFDCHLDTFPVGYVTTLYEGLWMERPAVTLRARPPMGRVGYGTMRTLGLGEAFCAENVEEYVRKAAALANEPQKLAGLAQGLRERMRQSKLMDYENFGRELAGLYRMMWENRLCQSSFTG